ncbi:ATP-binding protein [Streptomyces sp. NBC_01506]|uniref:ATP-binding protein n=1 Tax=Streptomyces sp. NBC_01506 TaxID=2903887 RepID=UPI00386B9539
MPLPQPNRAPTPTTGPTAQGPRIKTDMEPCPVVPSSLGHPAYSQTMPCAPESARRARLLVSAACNAWGLPGLADSAALVVSELVGNSVRHSGSYQVRVVVSLPARGRVRVAVVDKSRTPPTLRVADDSEEDGRGLAVVEALADRWGTEILRWGKRVWVELRPDETDGGQ